MLYLIFLQQFQGDWILQQNVSKIINWNTIFFLNLPVFYIVLAFASLLLTKSAINERASIKVLFSLFWA